MTYSDTEQTTGQSKEHSVPELARLSRYRTRSHQAGMRFFSLQSYPTIREKFLQTKCSEISSSGVLSTHKDQIGTV